MASARERTFDLGDMPEEELRHAMAEFCDWVCRYRDRAGELPVLARVEPGEIAAKLPATAPRCGDSPSEWLADLDRVILPGITHWNHPGFLAYFGISGSGPGILGELISAALNLNGMLWRTSPALTELEAVVLRWYREALGLPLQWFGMLTDTASTSTLVALAAAREATGLGIRDQGLSGRPPLVMYCSEEAHSSAEKAGMVLGLGRQGVVRITTDGALRLDPGALDQAIMNDKAQGRRPFAVVATAGTTSTVAVDPVVAVGQVCRRHNLWLHVDAAYAGSAAIAPEYRWVLDGCESADSMVVNPHKWLFTPVDCSALFTARPDALRAAFSLVPEYLRADDDAVDLMDYSFQLGRRFRALKLWFVFRYFGTEGIARRVREHCRLAGQLARWIGAHSDFELLAPPALSVVCFRACPGGASESSLEKLNKGLLARVNESGRVFLSHTRVRGRYALRVAVGNLGTDEDRIREGWEIVCRVLRERQ